MFRWPWLFLALLLCSSPGCGTSNEFPGDYKGDSIHFGQGGGITGFLNYFVLLEDGRLYHRDFRDSTFTLEDHWPDDFVSQMFSNYKTLHLDTLVHYHPGDQYYFIQFGSRDKMLQRIAWGLPGHRPADNVVTYYNLLYKSTKSKS